MVCKKSLYCLKNGPCANYQIRKQIWEDNIRFRESLRNLNQSDHYWSFQVTNNEFSDIDEPSFYKRKNKSCFKLRTCNDCASITHELSPPENDSNATCLCKDRKEKEYGSKILHADHNTQQEKVSSKGPSKEVQANLPSALGQRLKHPGSVRDSKNVPESSTRFRQCIKSSLLHPSSKVKFSSQSTLFQPKQNTAIRRCPSMDIISKDKNLPPGLPQNIRKKLETNKNTQLRDNSQEKDKQDNNVRHVDNAKMRANLLGCKDIKIPPWLSGPPISRTTRRKISQERRAPFATFGCNNINDAVGTKRTHNVLASKKEVFPNALSYKQQREDFIVKCLKNEKHFRNKLLEEGEAKKIINHSSLWANERSFTESYKGTRKNDTSSISRFSRIKGG